MAVKEKKDQKTVGVGVEALWRAMAKDTVTVIPKIMPSIVRSIEVIEGDGGLGSVLLLNLGDHHVESKRKQTEKIVELDDSEYRFALKVLEGPALTLRNFSALTTSFQLSKIGEQETLVDMKVVYETEKEEANTGDIALQPAISYIQFLEKYVLES
ncbi:phytohormone-binding protein-like [Prunus avium]|uniref:Phytohormone-binding protein-like n=2 Tax=Prunus TaxID=3754 RepID=A0A6P5S389_PRUAV|nr:PREDICTED: phytohormone-binding protein-like [Prunus mume]XP_021809132.1 phytohormone-binding protein-like [Prunus avium]